MIFPNFPRLNSFPAPAISRVAAAPTRPSVRTRATAPPGSITRGGTSRELYQDSDPWDYYERSKGHYLIHPETQALLEKMLLLLRDEGEEAAFAFIRREVLPKGGKRRP